MLKAKKVWSTIENEKPKKLPDNASEEQKAARNKEIQQFEENDPIAASIILSTLEPTQAQQILNLDEAKEIWYYQDVSI